MLKKRMLLLAASLAAFGAVMVGGAFAFTPVSTSDSSVAVDVEDPVTPDFNVLPNAGPVSIVADGNWNNVATLNHQDNDANYNWTLTTLDITTSPVTWTGTCGAFGYRLNDGVNTGDPISPGLSVPAVLTTAAWLQLQVPATGTEADCQVGGVTIQATFSTP